MGSDYVSAAENKKKIKGKEDFGWCQIVCRGSGDSLLEPFNVPAALLRVWRSFLTSFPSAEHIFIFLKKDMRARIVNLFFLI